MTHMNIIWGQNLWCTPFNKELFVHIFHNTKEVNKTSKQYSLDGKI